jgi:hypothetical protein
MLKSGDKFSPERTLKTLKYEKELESLQNELIHGHGVSLAQVPLPFFLVVDLPSLIPKSWLREVFLALRHFPCPRAWQAPHARWPPLSLASGIVTREHIADRTSQRQPRPDSPHLNTRQHIPDPCTHPD